MPADTFTEADFAPSKSEFSESDFAPKSEFSEADFAPSLHESLTADLSSGDPARIATAFLPLMGVSNQALNVGLDQQVEMQQNDTFLTQQAVTARKNPFATEPTPEPVPKQTLIPTVREVVDVASNVFLPLEAAGTFATKLGQDIVSKITGDERYGGNLKAWVMDAEQQSPAERFIAESAKSAPTAALFTNLGKQASEMAPMLGIGAAPGIAGRLVSGGFAGTMGLSLYDAAKELNHELGLPKDQQDAGKIAELKATLVTTGLFGALAVTHATTGRGPLELGRAGINAMRPTITPKPSANLPYRRPFAGTDFPMAGEGRPAPQQVQPASVAPFAVPLSSPTAPIGDQKNPDVIAEAMAQAEAARQQNKLDVAEADAQVRARLGDMAEGTKLDPESAQALIEAGGEMPRTEAVQFPVSEIKPETAAVEPIAEPAPAATGATAEFRDWRVQGTTIRHSTIGEKLSEAQAQEIMAGLEANGMRGRYVKENGTVILNSGLKSDLLAYEYRAGAIARRADKNLLEKKAQEQNKTEREKVISQNLETNPATKWIDETFGSDAMNGFNKLELAKYLTGESRKFGGAANNKWQVGLKKLGATTIDEIKVAYEKLKPTPAATEAKPITEFKFEQEYAQHIDLRSRGGDVVAQREKILREGFKKGANVNALPPSRGRAPQNVIERNFQPKNGDLVLLAPKEAWKSAPNGMEIKDGWKPKPHEAIIIGKDNPDMYQEYLRAKNEAPPAATGATAKKMPWEMTAEERANVRTMPDHDYGYGPLQYRFVSDLSQIESPVRDSVKRLNNLGIATSSSAGHHFDIKRGEIDSTGISFEKGKVSASTLDKIKREFPDAIVSDGSIDFKYLRSKDTPSSENFQSVKDKWDRILSVIETDLKPTPASPVATAQNPVGELTPEYMAAWHEKFRAQQQQLPISQRLFWHGSEEPASVGGRFSLKKHKTDRGDWGRGAYLTEYPGIGRQYGTYAHPLTADVLKTASKADVERVQRSLDIGAEKRLEGEDRASATTRLLQKEGFDSAAIAFGDDPKNISELVVFDPSKIKSATSVPSELVDNFQGKLKLPKDYAREGDHFKHSPPAATGAKGGGKDIESQGSWKEIKKKRADEIIKSFANSKWTSRLTGNATGSYGVDEIMSADGQPVLKTSIDSARQKGRVYEFVPYKKPALPSETVGINKLKLLKEEGLTDVQANDLISGKRTIDDVVEESLEPMIRYMDDSPGDVMGAHMDAVELSRKDATKAITAILEGRNPYPPIQPTPPPPAATPKAEGEPGAKFQRKNQTDMFQDMGADVRREFDQPGSYVSNMFAAIDKSRAEMGLEPMPKSKPRTWDAANEKALAKMNREPDWIPNLIDEVTASPRPLIDFENAGVNWYRAKIRAEFDNALQRINRAHEDGRMDLVAEYQADFAKFEAEYKKIDTAVGPGGTGTEAGITLQAQKMATGPDFSLIEMRLQKSNSAHDGGPLTDAESAEIQRQYDAIKLKNDELTKALADRDQRMAELEVKRALDAVEKQAKQQPQYPPQVIAQAKRIVEQHRRFDTKPVFETLSSFFGEGPGMGAATAGEVGGGGAVKPMPAAVLNAAAIRYGQKIMDGANTRAAFDAAVKTDFGNKADPYLQQIWDAANKHVDEYLASFDKPLGKPTAEKVKQKVKGTDAAEKKAATIESIGEKVSNNKRGEITMLVQKLARHYVEQGIKDREVLIDTIWEDLKTIDPEFTRRETMDAISGYGDFKPLSKDEISLTLRDLKGQMQQLGKLEDMAAGQAPLKSGRERPVPGDTWRQLIQQVNEAKKKGGFVITDPATQLATALTARKTYYRNRLSDLRQEISTRERIVKTKTPSPTDVELEGMKAEYAKLKEEHDAIFGQRELTPEQRLKMALAAVERQIAEYDRRIKSGDFKRKEPFKIVNPALDAARARREALKAEFVELRGLDEAYASEQRTKGIEQQKAALERTIAGLELKLSSGDFAPKQQAMNRPADPVLETLKQRRDELNQKLAEARKKPAAQKYAESLVRRLEAMNKRIAEKEAAIASGNVAVKPSAQSRPLSTPELELARQRLDELNRQIAEIRNPKKTDLERATQAAKTRLTNRIADLQDRLARGDFETRKRVPTDLSHDAEVMSLKSDLEVAHQAFLKGLHEDMLRKLNRRQKIWRGIKQGYGASVNIVSSFDLSAPRQLLFSILSNSTRLATTPKEGARVMVLPLARMLKAAVSEKTARDMEQQIKHRPNALSGVDKIAEIEYTDLSTDKFTRYEENAHSILDKWSEESFRRGNALKSTFLAPRTAGAKMVRASNRAFITALNQTRAALLDELLRVNFKDRPPTEVELKIIGNLVNVATGRGKMNPKTAERASTIFWAPKLMMSRAQTLALQPLLTGLLKNDFAATARARKIVAKEYARAIMGGALLYGVSQMFNDKKDRPLTSSDAGKVTRGKTRIDPWGGLQQFVVLVFRAVTGKSTNIKGKTEKIDDKYVLFTRFLRSKLHPVIGAAVDFGVGKNYVGQKWTPGQTVESLAVPLPLRDIKAIIRENGWSEGMIIWALGEFGMGVNVYDTNNQSKPGRY